MAPALTIPHPSHTTRVEFSRDGRLLLTAYESGVHGSFARLWNSATGEPESKWIHHCDEPDLVAIGFSASNRQFLTGGADGRLLIHSIDSCDVMEFSIRSRIADAIWSRDGESIVVAGTNKSLHVVCAKTGAPRFPKLKLPREPRSNSSQAMQISPCGRWLAVFAGVNATVIDLKQGRMTAQFKHRLRVTAMSWRNDEQLITSSDDYVIREWSIEDSEKARTITQMPRWIWTLQCTLDGKALLIGTEDEMIGPGHAGHAEVVDIESGRRLGPPMLHAGTVFATFNSTESRIATGSADRMVAIWDPATSMCLCRHLHGTMVFGVQFSPDGSRFASFGGPNVHIWDVP